MPRKNHKKPQKFVRFQMNAPKTDKKRYANEREVQDAVEYLRMTKNIELGYYQDIDGGWYLTKKK